MSLPEIVSRKVADLIPYARNARTHSDAQVAQIAASIREFGWTNPILLDGQNGIIAGHGRLMAARKLAITDVPCIELAGLTEAQRKAYILADNKLALNAGWDDEMLRLELGELAAMDFDMMLTGFSDDEFKEISGSCDEVGLPELNDGDRQPFQQMTFTVHDEQKEQIDAALLAAKSIGPFDSQNENSNGNALARVCEIFLTQHGV